MALVLEELSNTEITDVREVSFELGRTSSETMDFEEVKDECSAGYRPEIVIPNIVVISVLCFSGNSLVIFIYSRSKKIAETKVFELAFAVLDISACSLLLPMYFLRMRSVSICSYKFAIKFAKFSEGIVGPLAFTSYYSLLVCVAIDRFCAVFYPLQFKIMRNSYIRKMFMSVAVYMILTVVAVRVLAGTYVRDLYVKNVTTVLSILALLVIVILFSAIVVRIRRHGGQRAALGVGGQDAQHLKAVKIFSLITAFYVLGYVPFGFAITGRIAKEFVFLYYVNHICNPIIYVAVNE